MCNVYNPIEFSFLIHYLNVNLNASLLTWQLLSVLKTRGANRKEKCSTFARMLTELISITYLSHEL